MGARAPARSQRARRDPTLLTFHSGILGFLDSGIFGILGFWDSGIFGILDSGLWILDSGVPIASGTASRPAGPADLDFSARNDGLTTRR